MERYPVASVLSVQRQKKGGQSTGTDTIAEEVPVALAYNGISHAVMLATPADLEDFAIGFSLTEGIVNSPKEIYGIEVEEAFNGIRVDITIASEQFVHLKERRRNLTGRTGCGLCGTDSLAQAVKVLPRLSVTPDAAISPILAGFNQMASQQSLKQRTGATHAAAWLSADGTVSLIREDIGRHNALDKLIGALQNQRIDCSTGSVLVTSRASYEMVQKCVMAGIPTLAAVSAPTALAVRTAEQSGLLLLGFVRGEDYTVYANSQRLIR
ncbi:MAG: formate dehydrogenase accessory sulfurtransferase FdhD [Oxalobacter sp.]|nr:formate dehydrogenase accessory sulfurtransferase FdhD [Oxalobacter sp.]